MKKVLIIGSGFVGSSLAASLKSAGVQVYCTRRQRGEEGTGTSQFVLEEEETWRNLPEEVDGVVWTLPARPLSQVQRFYDVYLQSILDLGKPVIVYGTIGRYHVEEEHQWVDEKTRYKQTESGREEGENFLQEKGATVLVLAAIWGESKNGETRGLKAWIKKGYIQAVDKFLNLSHVDDIVKATEVVMERPELKGQAINVCDGNPMLWRDIILGLGYELPPMTMTMTAISSRPSKRVSNDMLQSIMGKDYKFQQVMDPVDLAVDKQR
ncbi:PREDICTED: uncharacterized protein LOC109482153 [Branchiostoma belcheri]|uniref:Uncharacterized protein LOC109482153 n=1 Tax=Branchiostoma belcheri TaxID=7741 RepID=A0A6P5A227_BRABE|nr:PREDICTED: uncharacterized protein LOC109482153 [Branchiostoma belcheri]